MENMEIKAARYIKLRDFKEAKEKEMKENIAKVVAAMDSIEAEFMTFLNQTGQESAKTASGTFFKRVTTKCSVGDWDTAFAFIQEHELYHMLNRAVNKTAVEAYIDEHKEVPPGVNVSREVAISVTRPKTR